MLAVGRQLARGVVAVGALCVFVIAPAGASAVSLTSPSDGASVSPTPSFSWSVGAGDDSDELELSQNPAIGSFGGFANDEGLRNEFLADTQRSFTVGEFGAALCGHLVLARGGLPERTMLLPLVSDSQH